MKKEIEQIKEAISDLDTCLWFLENPWEQCNDNIEHHIAVYKDTTVTNLIDAMNNIIAKYGNVMLKDSYKHIK